MTPFTKMHGLGNDFIVFDAVNQVIALSTEQIQALADRHFGIGCDQLLLVEPSETVGVDFRYRIFNADGGEVEQCGNGARCFARFVRDKGLSDKAVLTVETASGIIKLSFEENGDVKVNMGQPHFTPDALPFIAPQQADQYALALENGDSYQIGAVSMGNPHAVLQVDDLVQAPVMRVGAEIEKHARFPQRVNVGFMQVIDRQAIRLRVFERGAGETLACGTGACAAVVIGQLWGVLDEDVTVKLGAGNLRIQWTGKETDPVWMSGAASHVFEGTVQL